ncbi:MAG: hypothetical protein O9327_14980 [Polaromonas sp.]|nr:hypothetical protein [Polaromonas sp.]
MATKAKPMPRPFAKTRHIGQDHREDDPASGKAAALGVQPLSAAGLRRDLPLHGLEPALETPVKLSATSPAPRVEAGTKVIDSVEQLSLVAIGETVFVNTQLIADNPFNARVFYRSAEIDQTAQSIAEDKQDVAAAGWIEDGRIYLIDGGKRLRSVRSVSVPHLKVCIETKPPSDFDAWMKSRRMNDLRSGHTVYDDAVRFSDMLRTGKVSSQLDLMEKIKEGAQREMTKGHVSQIIGIASIPRGLMMRLVEVPALCSKNAAYEISRLFTPNGLEALAQHKQLAGEEGARIFAEQVVDQIVLSATRDPEMTSASVRDIVRRALGEATREPRAQTISTALSFGGFKGKLTALAKHGQLRLELNDVPPERMEEVQATLLRVLGEGSSPT